MEDCGGILISSNLHYYMMKDYEDVAFHFQAISIRSLLGLSYLNLYESINIACITPWHALLVVWHFYFIHICSVFNAQSAIRLQCRSFLFGSGSNFSSVSLHFLFDLTVRRSE